MEKNNISELLKQLIYDGGLTTYPAVRKEQIMTMEKQLYFFPEELKELYLLSNGCEKNEIKIFPIYNPEDVKNTWDDILRANDIQTTKFRIPSDSFLKKNLNIEMKTHFIFNSENSKIPKF